MEARNNVAANIGEHRRRRVNAKETLHRVHKWVYNICSDPLIDANCGILNTLEQAFNNIAAAFLKLTAEVLCDAVDRLSEKPLKEAYNRRKRKAKEGKECLRKRCKVYAAKQLVNSVEEVMKCINEKTFDVIKNQEVLKEYDDAFFEENHENDLICSNLYRIS